MIVRLRMFDRVVNESLKFGANLSKKNNSYNFTTHLSSKA